jgi:Carboxypeptidase regulatory-like domain
MKIFRANPSIRLAVRFLETIIGDFRILKLRPMVDEATRAISRRARQCEAGLFLGLILFVFPVLLLSPSSAKAHTRLLDDKKEAELRTVHGVVVDKNDNGISSGIVYLENMKTQNVRTYITDDAGNYRFSGLDPNEDYEIHAEKGDLTSSTRTISSFDSRRDIEVVLKLTHEKK